MVIITTSPTPSRRSCGSCVTSSPALGSTGSTSSSTRLWSKRSSCCETGWTLANLSPLPESPYTAQPRLWWLSWSLWENQSYLTTCMPGAWSAAPTISSASRWWASYRLIINRHSTIWQVTIPALWLCLSQYFAKFVLFQIVPFQHFCGRFWHILLRTG